jgi:hypothetical protein
MAANAQAANPINTKRFIWTSPWMAAGSGAAERLRGNSQPAQLPTALHRTKAIASPPHWATISLEKGDLDTSAQYRKQRALNAHFATSARANICIFGGHLWFLPIISGKN